MRNSEPSRGTVTLPAAARRRIGTLLAAGAAITALAACGSSSSSSSASSSSTTSSSSAHAAAGHAVAIPTSAKPGGAAPSAATLGKLRKVAKGGGVQAHLGGLGKLSLTQAVQVVSGDINKFWSSEFANSGVQWPTMQDVIVDTSPVSTNCSRSTVAPTDPWLLCDGASGGTFYWTIPWIQQNIATDQGGVNLAFSMAELWSFHIQNLTGATAAVQSGSLSKGQWAQQAVCLTGIYVRSLSDRKLFEQGDQQTAQAFITSLSSVAGITSPDVTSQQLQQAFASGFNSGSPSTCGAGGGGGGGSSTSTTSTTSGGGSSTIPLGASTTG